MIILDAVLNLHLQKIEYEIKESKISLKPEAH